MIDYSDAPVFSREDSFKMVLDYLKNTKNPKIVEIGCTRQVNDTGAGNSSELFAWFVTKYGGNFTTVDIDKRNVMVCKNIVQKYYKKNPRNINVICDDGIKFLKNLKESPDLLYLDSMDCSPTDYIPSAEHHVELFDAVKDILKPGCLVLIDDIYDTETYVGKGFLLIPYLMERYPCLHKGYQFLFLIG